MATGNAQAAAKGATAQPAKKRGMLVFILMLPVALILLPVTMVVVLFSIIQTFADFQLVYVLTGGGPANATHLFATYA